MIPLERLAAEDVRTVVMAYRDALRAHQEQVNALNVFPVPDGDTGTNMALTLESVVTALGGTEGMTAVCDALSRGSLMGARGNSGVILSQVLRGLAQSFRDHHALGAAEVAAALRAASEAAYKAVMNPVEGTILTVARGAADGAATPGGAGGSLAGVLQAARDSAAEALARTPDLLPVLKQAGVVDAGGAGFLLLLDAFLHVVDGRPLPQPGPGPRPPAAVPATGLAGDGAAAGHAGAPLDHGPRYEVMHLLDADDEAVDRLKRAWAELGDSIAAVGGDGLWNCHVHTDDIGAAIEAAVECGRPFQIRVTDLYEQVEQDHCPGDSPVSEPEAPVVTAAVVVAAGDGLSELFRSLGAHRLVAGGQSMNPSTEQILEAVETAPSAEVVVLPNNPNIAAVARQVDALAGKAVRVVETRSIAEGLAAMVAFDPAARSEDNQTAMAEAATRVVSGEVARAVRASTCDAGPIREGDWLGMSGKGIEVVAGSLGDAAIGLLDRLVSPHGDHEVVTVIEGAGAIEADTAVITAWLGDNRPGIEVEVHRGGQPLYPYLFSVE